MLRWTVAPLRIPAQQLEQAVLRGLIAFLNDDDRVLTAIGVDQADELERALKRAKALSNSLTGMGASYIARVMRLTFLAPDILERIRRGEAPPELTAERLSRRSELPIEWGAQRRLLGMDA